jgi:hypothetical protein
MNPDYRAIAQRANHRCEYCKAPEVVFNINRMLLGDRQSH